MRENLEKRLSDPTDPLSVYAYGWYRRKNRKKKKIKAKEEKKQRKNSEPSENP